VTIPALRIGPFSKLSAIRKMVANRIVRPLAKRSHRAEANSAVQCNIDAKGKAVRLIMGCVMVILAIVIGVLATLDVLTGWWWWAVGGLGAFGGFGIFEGWKGWCIVRAMGIRTLV
jgi:hypothetical protein